MVTTGPNSPSCQIVEQDCLLGMQERIQPESVDVVVTSPPYNLGVRYGHYVDALDEKEYLRWISNVGDQIERVLSPGGSFFLNLGGPPSRPGWPWEVLSEVARKGERFQLQNTILWLKALAFRSGDLAPDDPLDRDVVIGHYKPVNSERYLNGLSEYVFHLTKRGDVILDKLALGVPYAHKSNVTRWSRRNGDIRDRGNVWYIPYPTITRSGPHPCAFPPKLPKMCIELHGVKRTGLVLDPFAGSGSTAVACRELGLPFIGFEIDPEYAEIARNAVQTLSRIAPSPDRCREAR
jgi:site-specific DNA-methyltransferase (adenine-specific)